MWRRSRTNVPTILSKKKADDRFDQGESPRGTGQVHGAKGSISEKEGVFSSRGRGRDRAGSNRADAIQSEAVPPEETDDSR